MNFLKIASILTTFIVVNSAPTEDLLPDKQSNNSPIRRIVTCEQGNKWACSPLGRRRRNSKIKMRSEEWF